MNPISVLRFMRERLRLNLPSQRIEVEQINPDDETHGGLAAVIAPHGPRPRKDGAHAPLPKVDEEVLR